MKYPFLNLASAYDELKEELDTAYERVMRSSWFIHGQEVEAFEAAFARYCGTRHCIGVGNGLDALSLIMRAMNIGPGDEVIVPAGTFIATWLAVSQTGAVPVPVEQDEKTFNLDVNLIEKAVSERTKAIMPVHLYGKPADMAPVNELAQRFGLQVIEDAAQAHGARYNGKRVGSLGGAAAFSFYPGKNLGAFGDGGAVVTDDDEIADKVRLLSNYGSKTKYQHDVKGFNTRLDELQAAMLLVKLEKLDEWNDRRRRIAGLYQDALSNIPGLVLPDTHEKEEHVWHLYVVRHPNRNTLKDRLQDAGIGTLIHYPTPPYLSKAYLELGFEASSFPVATRLSGEVLSLPMGPHMLAGPEYWSALSALCR